MWAKFSPRRHERRRVALGSLTILTIILWYLGLLDHLFERSFTEFQWPSYANVRHQVDLELEHKASTYSYENDWDSITVRRRPTCGIDDEIIASSDHFLLIVVKSAAQNIANRKAIRSTWGAVRQQGEYAIRTVFVVGELHSAQRSTMGDVLSREADQYNDLLIGDFVDAYRNNTLKFLSSIKLSFGYCSEKQNPVAFALFIDDDYFLSVSALMAEVRAHRPDEDLYMGWRFDSSPFRFVFHKHRVSLAAYPFDRYPPYISAGSVLLSRRTILQLYYGIQHVRMYPYDDIYAGIVTYLLDIPPQHNPRMLFWTSHDPPPHDAICAHGFPSTRLLHTFKQFNVTRS